MAGEGDNARRVLRIILQEYGSSPAALSARTSLARIYFEEGNLEQARNELRRVIDGDPSPEARAQALLVLGNIHQSTGNTEDAKAAYQEITTKYRTSSALPGAYVSLGRLYQLRNEMFYDSDQPPLSFNSGVITTANGKSYDMASAEDKQKINRR